VSPLKRKQVYEDAYLDATSVYRIEEATYKGIAPPPPAGVSDLPHLSPV
jgi:hypothetical protein